MTHTARLTPAPAADRPNWFFPTRPGTAAYRMFLTGTIWMLIGMTYGLLMALYMAHPQVWAYIPLDLQQFLVWGKMRELHVQLVLWYWLSMGSVAGMYFIVPRLCRAPLWSERLAHASVWLWNIAGITTWITISLGMSRGREYAETILPVDVLLLGALLCATLNLVNTVRYRRERPLYVSLWYSLSAVIALPIVIIIGKGLWLNPLNNPYTGIYDNVTNWFFGHNILGMWYTPVGIGLAYFLIPKITKRPIYSHWLSLVGFWTLIFVYPPVGGHHSVTSALPYWLQTEAIMFSIFLFIPVFAAVWNLYKSVQPNTQMLAQDPALAFVVFGLTCYLLTSVQGSIMALRTLNIYEHFSQFTVGHAMLAMGAGFSAIVLAAGYYLIPRVTGHPIYSKALAWWHLALFGLGWVVLLLFLQTAGLVQSANWRVGGQDWMDSTVWPTQPLMWPVAGGGVLIITSHLIYLYNIVRTVYDRSWVPQHAPDPASLPGPTARDPAPAPGSPPAFPPATATD
ncbi:cbb3-type cytochrome c oxidase subunit I [Deinococcus marmoris]|uniref:Cytochrome c oxidase subunit CcoN n=1 Tax=Deinococcus marmoris TaxID=249408 RepID=A0A1U7NTI6_9DEIO|nr:cbb3-type cytochrome c oxidase subunit I [Deinococcus marmoris]OLV16232.1 Cytochrome c oxidase subunit CcoN [Deinococcus marmoris]